MRLAVVLLAASGCGAGSSSAKASGAGTPTPETLTTAPRTALPAWGDVPAPFSDALVEAELRRDPARAVIAEALRKPETRDAAAWTLARIGGPDALVTLAAAVADDASPPSSALLGAVAFLEPPAGAPGEAPEPTGTWAQLEDALWTRYAVTQDRAPAAALLLAIARVGGSRSQVRLAADTQVLPSPRQAWRYDAAMESMAILCDRGHGLPRTALRSVATGLAADAAPVRAAAAYALGRCAGPSAEQLAGEERSTLVERLVALVAAGDPEAARLGWKAMGGLGEVPSSVDLAILGPTPPPLHVEVEAVRALTRHADGRDVVVERLGKLSMTAVDDGRTHVVLEALRGIRGALAGRPELVRRLEGWSATVDGAVAAAQGRGRKRAALVQCELRVLEAIVGGDVARVDRCASGVDGLPTWYGERLGVDALVGMGAAMSKEDRMTMLLARARDPKPQVAAQALSALADVDDERVGPLLREAMARDDVGVQAAAASSIAARAVDASRRDAGAVPALEQAVGRLDNARSVEARIAAIEALGSLARSAGADADAPAWLERTVLGLASDPNAAVRAAARTALLGRDGLLARFDDASATPRDHESPPRVEQARKAGALPAGLEIRTDAGTIVVAFEGAPAPVMQSVLTMLARESFYDGITLHRVVPGFVVQGGDPHGDGYGGPGFIVPCERSTLRYEPGTMGIALAGKDTGGSQFFFTLTRQPHLDARYPVVGRIVKGQDVIDRILPHDRIATVRPWSGAGG